MVATCDDLTTPLLCAAGGAAVAMLLSSSIPKRSLDGAADVENFSPSACSARVASRRDGDPSSPPPPPLAISARAATATAAPNSGAPLDGVEGWAGSQVFSDSSSFSKQFQGRAPAAKKRPSRGPLFEKDNRYANSGRQIGLSQLTPGRCASKSDPTLVSNPDAKAKTATKKKKAREVMPFYASSMLEEESSSDEDETA